GSLDIAELNRAPNALRRLVIWRAMTMAAGGRHIGFDHVSDVIGLMRRRAGSLDLPGQRVQRIGGRIVIKTRVGSPGSTGSRRASVSTNLENPENLSNLENPNFYCYQLSIPGEVLVPESGCTVSAAVAAPGLAGARSATVGNDPLAMGRRDRLAGTLVGRNRRAGDRFPPFGLRGPQTLHDPCV